MLAIQELELNINYIQDNTFYLLSSVLLFFADPLVHGHLGPLAGDVSSDTGESQFLHWAKIRVKDTTPATLSHMGGLSERNYTRLHVWMFIANSVQIFIQSKQHGIRPASRGLQKLYWNPGNEQ